MSESVKISKAARNSCRRFLACVGLGKSSECDEDCDEVGDGIFETQPLVVGSKYDMPVMSIWS